MGADQRHHRRHRNELTSVLARFQVGFSSRVAVKAAFLSPSRRVQGREGSMQCQLKSAGKNRHAKFSLWLWCHGGFARTKQAPRRVCCRPVVLTKARCEKRRGVRSSSTGPNDNSHLNASRIGRAMRAVASSVIRPRLSKWMASASNQRSNSLRNFQSITLRRRLVARELRERLPTAGLWIKLKQDRRFGLLSRSLNRPSREGLPSGPHLRATPVPLGPIRGGGPVRVYNRPWASSGSRSGS
jgi:hypothetical protein